MEIRTKIVIYILMFLSIGALRSEEFFISRLKYSGGGDWYSNPTSINNLLDFVERKTGIDCADLEKTTSISDGTLFNSPYLYLTGHGKITITDDEAKTLRSHLLNGGFLHADDNYGLDKSFRTFVKKVFPDKELKVVPFSHPVYNIKYKMTKGLPKIHKHDDKPPVGYGIFHNSRLVLFYSFESDLGDGWEDKEVHNDPEEKRLEALKMGTNLVLYYLSS